MKKVNIILLASMLFTFSLVPTGWATPADSHYEEGNEFFKRGDYKAAVQAYTACIESLTQEQLGYGCFANRGSAKNNLGLYDDAIVDANEGINRYRGDYALGYYVRGYAYMAKKDYDKAIEDLQKALPAAQRTEKSLLKSVYRELGRSYYGKKLYEQAISELQKAIELDATRASPYWWQGNAFEKIGKTENAIKAYENFIKYATLTDSFVAIARKRIEKLSK